MLDHSVLDHSMLDHSADRALCYIVVVSASCSLRNLSIDGVCSIEVPLCSGGVFGETMAKYSVVNLISAW